MIKNIILWITIFFTILIFKNYSVITTNIIIACDLFIKKVFPALFPMFIISSILINLNFISYINLIFRQFCQKIFHINVNTSYILFMSMLSGFPSNAKIAKEMYDNKLITKNSVQKIILFSHFSNPLFILSMIKYHPLLVLIIHYLVNFIIGFSIRNIYLDQDSNTPIKNNIPFFESLTNAINNAMTTLLFILGTIVTFYILSSIINIPFFKITLEVSQGLNYLNLLDISIKYKTMLSVALLSFGGFCVHYQVYGILSKLKLKYYPYFLARLSHAIISSTIIYFLV